MPRVDSPRMLSSPPPASLSDWFAQVGPALGALAAAGAAWWTATIAHRSMKAQQAAFDEQQQATRARLAVTQVFQQSSKIEMRLVNSGARTAIATHFAAFEGSERRQLVERAGEPHPVLDPGANQLIACLRPHAHDVHLRVEIDYRDPVLGRQAAKATVFVAPEHPTLRLLTPDEESKLGPMVLPDRTA